MSVSRCAKLIETYPKRLTAVIAAKGGATKQFLEEITKWTTQHGVSQLSWEVAVKFLMARKFDVLLAIELFHSYRETRLKEGIVKLQPQEEPLHSELLSGKFTVLSVRDPSGASIALYTAKLHHPNKTGNHVVLQALFYLLDRAVESFNIYIYIFKRSKDLRSDVITLLFQVEALTLAYLLLLSQVQMVKMSDLRLHLPRDCLPEHLGGLLPLDAHGWNEQLLAGQNGRVDPVDELVGIPLADSSVHTPGLEAMCLQEFMAHLGRLQRSGIHLEYVEIRKEQPPGTFHCALTAYNQERNRYGDVLCLDQTRVRLKTRQNERSDYINASFMDGYKQKNAYIGTQGPLEKTYGDFWRMVWEQNVLVIVMTTRTNEGGRKKCGQYWPLEEGGQEVYSHMAVVNQRVDNHSHYSQTTLELYNMENCEQKQVTHFQYLSWPDYGVPTSALTLIDFLGAVKRQQRQAVKGMGPRWRGHPLGPPMVVHCSAGIGRTGTFCALDICLSQLQDMGTLNVCQTVRWMRTQRAFTIQTPDQYYFCHNAILEHAQRQGLLSASQ
uniref:protein-tyrosine-phosphatase n=1 Tax=Oncorhynchus mykiss TaxID=8022 RepID=A0A8C7WL10_ONCMY